MIEAGSKVPEFKTINQYEEEIIHNHLYGKKTIFYLYPKDDTPRCKAEGCHLCDNYDVLLAAG